MLIEALFIIAKTKTKSPKTKKKLLKPKNNKNRIYPKEECNELQYGHAMAYYADQKKEEDLCVCSDKEIRKGRNIKSF